MVLVYMIHKLMLTGSLELSKQILELAKDANPSMISIPHSCPYGIALFSRHMNIIHRILIPEPSVLFQVTRSNYLHGALRHFITRRYLQSKYSHPRLDHWSSNLRQIRIERPER